MQITVSKYVYQKCYNSNNLEIEEVVQQRYLRYNRCQFRKSPFVKKTHHEGIYIILFWVQRGDSLIASLLVLKSHNYLKKLLWFETRENTFTWTRNKNPNKTTIFNMVHPTSCLHPQTTTPTKIRYQQYGLQSHSLRRKLLCKSFGEGKK